MSEIDHMAMCIGYGVMLFGGGILLGVCIYLLAIMSNRAQNAMLSSYGGWKVFRNYVKWYKENNMGGKAP